MDHESVWVVAGEEASELLRRPLGRPVFCDIPMHDATRADLQHQEHVDEPERGRDRHEEIARQGSRDTRPSVALERRVTPGPPRRAPVPDRRRGVPDHRPPGHARLESALHPTPVRQTSRARQRGRASALPAPVTVPPARPWLRGSRPQPMMALLAWWRVLNQPPGALQRHLRRQGRRGAADRHHVRGEDPDDARAGVHADRRPHSVSCGGRPVAHVGAHAHG
jgi:hypothetical protein